MQLTNNEIFLYANSLMENFNELDLYIPAKANFFIQKNIKILAAAANEINEARLVIAKQYGELKEETQSYVFPQDKIEIVSKEIEELLAIEQDLDIKTFSIDALGNTELTTAQMQSLMFMIED